MFKNKTQPNVCIASLEKWRVCISTLRTLMIAIYLQRRECTTEGHYICQGFTLLDVNWDICLTMSPPAFLVPIYRQ